MNKWARLIMAVFAVIIGFYPLGYLISTEKIGLLNTKSVELLSSQVWFFFFYMHILLGGIALLSGWSQFFPKFRIKYIDFHRRLGSVYLFSVFLSGMAAFYLSFYASTGKVAGFGFGSLAVLWMFSTFMAFLYVKQKKINLHLQWMTISYSMCLAAVTLRIWMPVMIGILGLSFAVAYPIVAWLCWVPNLFVAVWVNSKIHNFSFST
jgi:hypothetical protein